MQRQLLELTRRGMPAEVAWRSAYHRATDGQAAGYEIRVQVVGDANRHIDAIVHEIDQTVGHDQINRDTRVAIYIAGDGPCQLRLSERGTDRDA